MQEKKSTKTQQNIYRYVCVCVCVCVWVGGGERERERERIKHRMGEGIKKKAK